MAITHANATPTGWTRTKKFTVTATTDVDVGPYNIPHGFTGLADAAAARAQLNVSALPLGAIGLASAWTVDVDQTNIIVDRAGGVLGSSSADPQLVITVNQPHSMVA